MIFLWPYLGHKPFSPSPRHRILPFVKKLKYNAKYCLNILSSICVFVQELNDRLWHFIRFLVLIVDKPAHIFFLVLDKKYEIDWRGNYLLNSYAMWTVIIIFILNLPGFFSKLMIKNISGYDYLVFTSQRYNTPKQYQVFLIKERNS